MGTNGANGGVAILTANHEILTGDVIADTNCVASATLQNESVLTGAIQNASLTLDSSSRWHVTGDSILAVLTNSSGIKDDQITNIFGNGHEVRYDASIPANRWLAGKTYSLAGGGSLTPKY